MQKLIWILIILAALSFVLASILAYSTETALALGLGVQPEGFSNACTNLSLLAIAIMLVLKKKTGNT